MLTLAIIDDEPAARELIRHILRNKMPDVRIVGEAGGIMEAVEVLQRSHPEVVLLDVELADGSGFDLIHRYTGPPFQVIFITAYDEFAFKAFRYSALDYLVKPFDPEDLVAALHKVRKQQHYNSHPQQLENIKATNQTQRFEKIALPTAGALHLVSIEAIVRVESDAGYSTVHTRNSESILLSRSIKEFEELLPVEIFFRIHQSHLINIQFAEKVLFSDGDQVLMKDGAKLPLSRRRKDAFMDMLTRSGSVRRL
ncbi:MAG TPA: LytTR family DNA-binding domain-containing protein [Saprospiraceae bacterium]|nr:LytTR family DNA-binding domain-containing protein [Saprospiraceae bacterium]